MSELISGKEALKYLTDGVAVLVHESTYKEDVWFNLSETKFSLSEIINERVDKKPYKLTFKLKPRTITINGIEVPAPFEPKDGELYWYITDSECGYSCIENKHRCRVGIAAWRTRDEIEQVVSALRSIFKGEM